MFRVMGLNVEDPKVLSDAIEHLNAVAQARIDQIGEIARSLSKDIMGELEGDLVSLESNVGDKIGRVEKLVERFDGATISASLSLTINFKKLG